MHTDFVAYKDTDYTLGMRVSRVYRTAVSLVLLAILFAAIGCSGDRGSPIVAMVDGREITLEDVDGLLNRLIPGGMGDVEDVELKNLRLDLLNQIIEEELILQEAGRMGLNVSMEEVMAEVAAFKDEYIGKNFEVEVMEAYGTMQKWHDDIRKRILIKKVIETLSEGIEITEQEIRDYYREHRDEYKIPPRVRARIITVGTEEEAKEARERLKEEDFAAVAREVSISPEAERGGDLGFFGKGSMPKEFEDVVFSLPAGGISGVVKTAYGYHIFLVEEKKKGKRKRLKELKEKIRVVLQRGKEEAEFQSLVKGLKGNANIEVKEDLL